MRRLSSLAARAGPPVTVLLLALAVWEVAARTADLPTFVLPAPADVWRAARSTRGALFDAAVATMLEVAVGLAIALALGVATAALLAGSGLARRAFFPLLVASQTVPILAVAPLLIIWFGFGMAPKVAIVVLVCFFPLAVNTAQGLGSADPDAVKLLRSMGAGRLQIWRTVRAPAALPSFFAGLEIAVTYCVVAAMIGEWVGGSAGLGLYLLRSKNALATDQVFAAIFVTAALSIGLFAIVTIIERAALPWRRADQGKEG